MVVVFDWPNVPPPPKKTGRKRKKTEAEARPDDGAAEQHTEISTGFAAVTGKWSNDITIYKGGIDKDSVAAVIKGASPHSNCHGCDYAHSEVIYSLEVIGKHPHLTLASASLDGSVRTWELYSTRDARNGYALKKPRKGAGDWTCASVNTTPSRCGSSISPTKILVLAENETIAVQCDDRIIIYCRGCEKYDYEPATPGVQGRNVLRFQLGLGPAWSEMATLRADPPGGGFSIQCVSVVNKSEIVAGCQDGSIQIWTHDGSSNWHAWGVPLKHESENPNDDLKMRSSNLTLKGHSKMVTGIATLSLPFCEVMLSTSVDKTIRVWQNNLPSTATCTSDAASETGDARTSDKWRSAMTLKGFDNMLHRNMLTFPERQEFACHTGSSMHVWRIDQSTDGSKCSSSKLRVSTVAQLRTEGITCTTKLTSDVFAVGFGGLLASMGISSTKRNVQIWRRDAEKGQWSASNQDGITGLPNSIWGIVRVPTPSGGDGDKNRLRLLVDGGGGTGPSFDSTWQETEDGAWKKIGMVTWKD